MRGQGIGSERKGFEPPIGVTLYTLSRRAPSTTRPPLQIRAIAYTNKGLSSTAVLDQIKSAGHK
jgi:hypothetical protein